MANETNTPKQTHLTLVEAQTEEPSTPRSGQYYPVKSGSGESLKAATITGAGVLAAGAALSLVAHATGSFDKDPSAEKLSTPATPNVRIVEDDSRAAQLDSAAPRVSVQELEKFRARQG